MDRRPPAGRRGAGRRTRGAPPPRLDERAAESGAEAGAGARAARIGSRSRRCPADRLAPPGRLRRAPGRAARGGGASLGRPDGDAAREPTAAGHDPLVLVLEHLQDPANFGTLLRSAEAAGVDGVVFPERGAAPLSRCGGQSERRGERAPAAGPGREPGRGDPRAEGARASGSWRPTRRHRRPPGRRDLTGPIAVVVGSEGSGVSRRRRASLRPARQLPDGRPGGEPQRGDRGRAAPLRGRPAAIRLTAG